MRTPNAALLVILLFSACGGRPHQGVSDAGGTPLPFELETFSGIRDGDRLRARAVYGSQQGQLELSITVEVGVPSRLLSGTYSLRSESGLEEGSISSRSVTFLGGQSDRPSLGGTFQLNSAEGVRYIVRIPTQQLQRSGETELVPRN